MQNQECLEIFEKYLREEKKASANTLSSYLRDIRQLGEYLEEHSEHGIIDADEDDLSGYIGMLRASGKSVATVSRSIASIKCLYSYLCIKQLVKTNPALGLVPDKSTQKLPQILTEGEIQRILDACHKNGKMAFIFCGDAALDDTKMADRLTRFLLGAMKGDVCSISSLTTSEPPESRPACSEPNRISG